MLKSLKQAAPKLIYLKTPDVDRAMEWIGGQRVNGQGVRDWEQGVSAYIASSPLGQKMGYHGVNGLKSYFAYRQEVELRLVEKLGNVLEVEIRESGAPVRNK